MEYQEALPHAEAYRAAHPNSFRSYPDLAYTYAGLGRTEEGLAAVKKFQELLPASVDGGAEIVTDLLSRLGRTDEALEVVRKNVRLRTDVFKRNDLLLRLEFAKLRKDPRFIEIAQKAPL